MLPKNMALRRKTVEPCRKRWRRKYMTLHMRDLVNREDGREEGLAMAILRILKKNGSITQTADLLDLSAQEVSDIAKKYGVTP